MSRVPGVPLVAHGILRRCAGLLPIAALAACGPLSAPREAGVAVRTPPGWTKADPATVRLPGRVVAAWAGPSGSSLAVYETLPIPAPDARALEAELANRLEHLPGLRVVGRGVIRVDGRPASWVEVIAPGTGDALAPGGSGVPAASPGSTLIPTRRTWIAVPRDSDTIHVVWHGPESAGPVEPSQFLAVTPDVPPAKSR